MCRPLLFHYKHVVLALRGNLPTPFGMFLEANEKPARGHTERGEGGGEREEGRGDTKH